MGPMEITALVVLGLMCLVVFGGLGWLLFRRCQISIIQVFFAIVVYALLLVPWRAWVESRHDPDPGGQLPAGAFCLAMLLGVGLFLGARNTKGLETSRRAWRWLTFSAGLLLPLTFVSWFIALLVNLSFGLHRQEAFAALSLSLLLLAEATALLVNWARNRREQGK